MGWLYSNGTRKDNIRRITDVQYTASGEVHSKTLRYCLRGNNLWALTELCVGPEAGQKYITLYLLRKDHYGEGWGYKSIDESCGPCYYNCPKSYIKEASEPINQYAAEWREAVLAN